MEKPMVSTAIGCEGIDVVDREHLLIRDDPDQFAATVLELMRNRELARALARNGRELMLARYTWEAVVATLEQFYARLIATGTPAPHKRATEDKNDGEKN